MADTLKLDALSRVPELLALAGQAADVQRLVDQKVADGPTSGYLDKDDRRALRLIADMLRVKFFWAAHAIADGLRAEIGISR